MWPRLLSIAKSLPTSVQIFAPIAPVVAALFALRGYLYGWALDRIEEARTRQVADLRRQHLGTNFVIANSALIGPSKPWCVPTKRWATIVERAEKWKARKLRKKELG